MLSKGVGNDVPRSATCCRICGSTSLGPRIVLKERMIGIQECFEYQRCSGCGCLQIVSKPKNIETYYASEYYSYAPLQSHRWKVMLRSKLAINGPKWLFSGRSWWEAGHLRSLRESRISRSDRILDLGCGSGHLIAALRDIGFRHVLGVDPFIAAEILHRNGTRVLKCEAGEVTGQFDLVMMHHSLEHVWDQHQIMNDIARLLAPAGRCIIRIPTIDSWAWEEYGPDWVQLDPPRHFYLHSRGSISRLLESVGLKVSAIVDDSWAFQILGSEKVRRGYSLLDPETGRPDYAACLPADLVALAPRRAQQLNRNKRGDAIAVHARLS